MDIRGYRNNKIEPKKNTNYLGFSLIELIIVIAIMAVLLGLVSPAVVQYVRKNKIKACHQNREAILAIYQRCVYDSSVEISLNVTDMAKMIPTSKSADSDGSYAPVKHELSQYAVCPLGGKLYSNSANQYGINTAAGTAWIYCADCEDYASIDMVGWSNKNGSEGDDATPPSPAPTTTPEITEECTVKFALNGHGKPQPSPLKVKKGDSISSAQLPTPSDPTYIFMGWYNEPSCMTLYAAGTKIENDITLYAKWEGMGSGSDVWPYPEDLTWWTEEGIAGKGDRVAGHDFTNSNNQSLELKLPTGIFTSRAGGQFVGVRSTDTLKLYQSAVRSPEYYLATSGGNWMIQLSGQTWEYDLDELAEQKEHPGQIYEQTQVGDLVIFKKGDAKYVYVLWDTPGTVNYSGVDSVTGYPYKLGNMYRVEP